MHPLTQRLIRAAVALQVAALEWDGRYHSEMVPLGTALAAAKEARDAASKAIKAMEREA